MRLRSSILTMPPCMDNHYVDDHLSLLVSWPLYSFVVLSLDNIGIWKVLAVQIFLCFPRFSFNHNKCDATSPLDDGHVFLFHSLCVWIPPWISQALIFAFPFREVVPLPFFFIDSMFKVWSFHKLLTNSS